MTETAVQKREDAAVTESPTGTITPRVDVLETDHELLLHVDMPGVRSEDVDIRFENGELSLHGRRTPKQPARPWLWEYEAGSYFRTFRVADNIDAGKIAADMKNGVLTVHLPKVEAVKPRRIAVKAD